MRKSELKVSTGRNAAPKSKRLRRVRETCSGSRERRAADGSALRGGLPIHRGQFMEGKSYQEAISFDALYKGMKKASCGVMWKNSVISYRLNGVENTWKLRQDLLNGTYRISEYQRFTIFEPKQREIVATRIRDRQYQRSLCDNILYPQITRGFIYDNCACLRGKGVDFALDRLKCHMQRYYRKHGREGWVLKCDIRHYFPETPHEVAKSALRKRIRDPDALKAAENIIDSFGGEKGIGLGSQVSQLVELAVLDDLDHFIKERLRIKHYIRYMDDFLLIHESKEVLVNALKEIRKRVNALGLELNQKSQIFPMKHGIRFLKWRHILTRTGRVIRKIHRSSPRRERKRLKELANKARKGLIAPESLKESYLSWKAHAAKGQTGRMAWRMEQEFRKIMKWVETGGEQNGSGKAENRGELSEAARESHGESGSSCSQVREACRAAGAEAGGRGRRAGFAGAH